MVRVAIGLVLILVIVGYSAFSVITTGQVLGIDARLFLVVAPILAAVSWAAFNIGRAAVGQLQLAHSCTADVESSPADGGQDRGNHQEQAGIDTQNLARGDHAEGRVTDDHQDEDQTDGNSDHS